MAARSLTSAPFAFPIQRGMLSVSAGTAPGAHETDGFDLVVDDGEVCVYVVKLRGAAAHRPGLLGGALAATRIALKSRLPVYELVADVRRFALAERGVEVGLALLRFALREARVEILNAGMPPLLRFVPGSAPALYPQLSAPIGARFGEVHPYELSPLAWGSTWAIVSDGVTAGSVQEAELTRRVAGSELERRAAELAFEPGSTLARIAAELGGDVADDRTLAVIHADPRHRFDSGIDAPRPSGTRPKP